MAPAATLETWSSPKGIPRLGDKGLFGTVSGTVWSVGHLVYAHSKKMFDKYGVGLGMNTMQGREAKHVQIAGYARNSQFKQRWVQVFKHDHISKLWLPLQ